MYTLYHSLHITGTSIVQMKLTLDLHVHVLPDKASYMYLSQLVEHCTSITEIMGLSPVKASEFFSGPSFQLL